MSGFLTFLARLSIIYSPAISGTMRIAAMNEYANFGFNLSWIIRL